MRTNLDRRHFLGLAGLGAGAAALAACGGPSTAGTADAVDTATIDFSGVKPAASIDFWTNHPGKSQDVEKAIIEKFHAKFPDIKVNLVTAGANYEEIAQKFQTSQAAKTGLPGLVVLSDVWWFRYFSNGSIIPIDGLVKQLDIKIDDFQKSLVDDYKYDNKQWALPYGRSTPLFYYNKDHFKAAGLPDRAPATWQEFAEWAPKLKATSGAQYAYIYPALAGYAGWTLQNNLWGWGGAWSKGWDITCDSKESVAALQWAQDSIYKDGWAGVSSKEAADDFAAGITSSTISSTGSLLGVLKAAKFNVGVGFLPGGPEVPSSVCPTGGAGLGIPSGITKEEQLAAATFLKFMTEPENTAAFSAATGYMPTRLSADMSSVLAATPQIKTAMDQLAATKVQDNARVFLPGADQEMAKSAAKILTQQGDVQATMTELKKTLEGIYTKDVKPKLKS
ncbi:ABC transporter substrate-binding protein [Arthrobacter sp. StoSoilB3]|jgi:sn-glycerol 3-phosphate transport system substrate-binding protein|uniref:Sn-glycerol 3-phosphate transport system substrate-binding protein n=2 Tax=Paenarthrobacter nicotinovorans TaxID=29320 RepID=A0ABT9TK19_PAENI|nr:MULTISPECIES: ABC transporter substrate-binding protein [Paenarthrobacter]KIA72005.1 Sn-glycerol-3-phosphate-binding extracellular protein UgpB [Arthrobacter sp. MWB30]KQR06198.1 carbohydrate-binding protein [Arthrobacter sp. Leaf145]SKB35505.1 carbohydrate ABC transporter substrate-binding protein, CUT1 family [Arthrobacter sp. 31Cvi3.1E]BCW11593.1 ABC transporter substrate-binding protein [Arthrobacter sp. NtRootA2]BCW15677.1 ABC transporter substrate-binding protein [Arthrobacter sp. NtR